MFMQILKELKADWGKRPLCNGRPERAPHIGTFCFPICWRCLGISLGVIILYVVYSLGFIDRNLSLGVRFVILAGIVPCLVDYLLQHWTKYISNNPRRFILGMLAGISIRIGFIWLLGI